MSATINAFLALLRVGLWRDGNSNVRIDGTTDWNEIYQLAQEQSVQGVALRGIEDLIAKGIELNVPKVLLLQWIGEVQVIEQRNKDMNAFIANLIEKLRQNYISALLVKGQGIAQCYEKPLWRCSGDIDLFLSDDNYQKAKSFFMPLASSVEDEYVREKHLGMTIDGWVVELHGHLYSGLSSRVEEELDKLQEDTFYGGQVRSWMNGQTQVFLLKAENDAFYVFTHILQHFFKEGVGLRQICDWCRLLYTYRDTLDYGLLESRIRKAGLMSEWKAFGAMAIEYLGLPIDAMPLLNLNVTQKSQKSQKNYLNLNKKAERIMKFILKSGNMGHNRDMSHFSKYPYLIRKYVSMGRRISDLINHARMFPMDSLRFFPRIMFNGVRSAMKGE